MSVDFINNILKTEQKTTLTKNNIFYHLFCINDAEQRFQRTYKKIVRSGLISNIDHIYINCVGEHKKYIYDNICNMYKVIAQIGDYGLGEAETLDKLVDFAKNNETGKTLYLHSKGCYRQYTNKPNSGLQSWIDCMEYFLIEKFEECLKYLDSYDNCGILYNQRPGGSEYSGNFWWSTNKYLSKLDYTKRTSRWKAEYSFLLPHKSKYKELYRYHGSHYRTNHERSNYTKDKPLV